MSPCDSAPLLKGPIETVEVTLGGAVVTIVALQKLGVVPLLAARGPRPGVSGDASELYLFGRRPTKRDASLFDHLGTHLMSVPMDRLPALVDLLCADLAAQEGYDLSLRGVAVRRPGGFVVMHERVRGAWDEVAADLEPSGRPAPLPILGAHVGVDEVLVTARSPDQPHGAATGPLLAVGVMDPITGTASAVALAASMLADPTDLRSARRLQQQVPMEQVPAGDPGSLAEWVRRFD